MKKAYIIIIVAILCLMTACSYNTTNENSNPISDEIQNVSFTAEKIDADGCDLPPFSFAEADNYPSFTYYPYDEKATIPLDSLNFPCVLPDGYTLSESSKSELSAECAVSVFLKENEKNTGKIGLCVYQFPSAASVIIEYDADTEIFKVDCDVFEAIMIEHTDLGFNRTTAISRKIYIDDGNFFYIISANDDELSLQALVNAAASIDLSPKGSARREKDEVSINIPMSEQIDLIYQSDYTKTVNGYSLYYSGMTQAYSFGGNYDEAVAPLVPSLDGYEVRACKSGQYLLTDKASGNIFLFSSAPKADSNVFFSPDSAAFSLKTAHGDALLLIGKDDDSQKLLLWSYGDSDCSLELLFGECDCPSMLSIAEKIILLSSEEVLEIELSYYERFSGKTKTGQRDAFADVFVQSAGDYLIFTLESHIDCGSSGDGYSYLSASLEGCDSEYFSVNNYGSDASYQSIAIKKEHLKSCKSVFFSLWCGPSKGTSDLWMLSLGLGISQDEEISVSFLQTSK